VTTIKYSRIYWEEGKGVGEGGGDIFICKGEKYSFFHPAANTSGERGKNVPIYLLPQMRGYKLGEKRFGILQCAIQKMGL
jgi:hypothetical protein